MILANRMRTSSRFKEAVPSAHAIRAQPIGLANIAFAINLKLEQNLIEERTKIDAIKKKER